MKARYLSAIFLSAGCLASQAGDLTPDEDLLACSIIYQEIGTLHAGRGDIAQSEAFLKTSGNYAMAGEVFLRQRIDPEKSQDIAETKIPKIVDALNRQSQAADGGDLAVIEQWLPYCNGFAKDVEQVVARETALPAD